MKLCLVNGIQQNHIDIESRGLAYGDGIFTTAKIQQGQVQYLSKHIQRLFDGCRKLGISSPQKNSLKAQLTTLASQYSLAVLKVIISAKSGGRGYARNASNDVDVIIMVYDYPKQHEILAGSGLNLGVSTQRIGLNPMLAGLKHLNRLEQVLLRQELSTREENDLLALNLHDEVIEAISANLFFFSNKQLYTPDLSQSGVNGIMRQTILHHYPDTIVKSVSLADLGKADEILLCNCVMGVMPVSTFNNQSLAVNQVKALQKSLIKAESLYD